MCLRSLQLICTLIMIHQVPLILTNHHKPVPSFSRERRGFDLLIKCSLLKHKSEIEMLLRDNKIDILALNETKIDEIVDDSLINIDGYFHERHDRNRHGGGVLIYIKDAITYEKPQIDDTKLCDLETITIQVKPKCAKPFVIIAWYGPPNHKIDDIPNIEKVHKTFDKTDTEGIILGDVNCDDLPDQDKTVLLPNLGDFINNINSDNSSNIQLGPLTSLVHCLTTLQPTHPTLSLYLVPNP